MKRIVYKIIWFTRTLSLMTIVFLFNLNNVYGQNLTQEAMREFKRVSQLAEQGDVDAKLVLAGYYETGYGTAELLTAAFKLYLDLAESGIVIAQVKVAEMYRLGRGTQIDKKAANEWYIKAADHGEVDACFKVGELYYKQKMYDDAFPLLLAVADHGQTVAQCYVGECYFYGYGVERDYYKSLYWSKRSADEGNNAFAQYLASILIRFLQDYGRIDDSPEDAFRYAKKSADQGNTPGREMVAKYYREGYGVERNYEKSFYYFSLLANEGFNVGLRESAKFLLEGRGVQRDSKKALEYLNKAINANDKSAAFYLAQCYYVGNGVKRNKKKGRQLLQKAVELNSEEAKMALTLIKNDIEFVPVNNFSVRDNKKIKDLCKALRPKVSASKYVYTYWSPTQNKDEVRLSLLPREFQTTVEKDLLNIYKEVIVVEHTPKLYYVVDGNSNVGIYSIEGELLMAPIQGKIRIMCRGFNFMLVGDMTSDSAFDIQEDMYIRSGTGVPTGCGQGILMTKNNKWLIQPGTYAAVCFARKIAKNYYYVAQYDESGELMWGLLDHKADVKIPIQYRSIGVKGGVFLPGGHTLLQGGKFVGMNDMSMDEFVRMNYERYNGAAARDAAIGDALMGIGNALLTIGEAIPGGNTPVSGVESTSRSSNSSSLKSNGQDSPNGNMSEVQAFNTDRRTYSKCETLLINMSTSSSYEYSDQIRQSTQSQMKSIRTKWAARGMQINQSQWETWGGK